MPKGISKLTGLPIRGMLGKKLSEKHKRKLFEANKGRHCSEEAKRKMSEIAKRNGHRPSFKGYHHTKETKRRISLIQKGRKLSEETKMKMRGRIPWNWKGGKTREHHHGNGKYKQWRSDVFQRDNWTCQTCGIRSSQGEPVYLEAHHIKFWAKYPELRFDINNGITLCVDCHKTTDTYANKSNNKL